MSILHKKGGFLGLLRALRGTLALYLYFFRQMGGKIKPLTYKKGPVTVFLGCTKVY